MFYKSTRMMFLSLLLTGVLSAVPAFAVRNPADPGSYQFVIINSAEKNDKTRISEHVAKLLTQKGYAVVKRIEPKHIDNTLIVSCSEESNNRISDSIITLPFEIVVGVFSAVIPNYNISCTVCRASDNLLMYRKQQHSAKALDSVIKDVFQALPDRKSPEVKAVSIEGTCDNVSLSMSDRKKSAIYDAKCKALEMSGSSITVNLGYRQSVNNKTLSTSFYKQIDEQFTAILLEGYTIDDLGMTGAGIYRVRLNGKIVLN